MKRKLLAVLSGLLCAALLAPLGTSALGRPGEPKDPNASAKLTKAVNSLRDSENREIRSVRAADKALVARIDRDLKKLASNNEAQADPDYQTIVVQLGSFKAALEKDNQAWQAAMEAYRSAADASARLAVLNNSLIPLLTQMGQDMDTWSATLKTLLQQADALVGKYGGTAGQTDPLKATIASQSAQIRQGFSDCRSLISQITATVAANSTAVAANPDGAASVEAQLKTIAASLKGIYDGSIRSAELAYRSDVRSGNMAGAAAELQKIIGIQQSRIAALAQAKAELQNTLTALKGMLAQSK